VGPKGTKKQKRATGSSPPPAIRCPNIWMLCSSEQLGYRSKEVGGGGRRISKKSEETCPDRQTNGQEENGTEDSLYLWLTRSTFGKSAQYTSEHHRFVLGEHRIVFFKEKAGKITLAVVAAVCSSKGGGRMSTAPSPVGRDETKGMCSP